MDTLYIIGMICGMMVFCKLKHLAFKLLNRLFAIRKGTWTLKQKRKDALDAGREAKFERSQK